MVTRLNQTMPMELSKKCYKKPKSLNYAREVLKSFAYKQLTRSQQMILRRLAS